MARPKCPDAPDAPPDNPGIPPSRNSQTYVRPKGEWSMLQIKLSKSLKAGPERLIAYEVTLASLPALRVAIWSASISRPRPVE
jgi:hypothetical protein